MRHSRPSRKRDTTWRTFELVGARPSRSQLNRPIRDSNGHVAKRFEIKGLHVDWTKAPVPRGVKRDHAESLVAPVRDGEQLVPREVTYAPTLCLSCKADQADKHSVFCDACRNETRKTLARFA